MLALSIRQPYAEMILRGMKTIEYRTRPTRIIGERFHIYAAGQWPVRRSATVTRAWSLDLAMPGEGVPPWLVELANGLRLFPGDLPTGVIVGSAVIEKVSRMESPAGGEEMWQWHLADVERAATLLKPERHAQPMWWRPF